MREYPRKAIHDKLVGYLKNLTRDDVPVSFGISIGGKDYTRRMSSHTLSWDSGAPPWTLNTTISGRLDKNKRNAPVRLDVEVGGIGMDAFLGHADLPSPQDDWTTQVVAGTPGVMLDKATLKEYVTYNSASPKTVIRDAVSRIKRYDRSKIDIQVPEKPLITRGIGDSGDGFEDESKPLDILTSVQDEIECVYFDTVLKGFVAQEDPGLGETSPVVWQYDVDTDEVLDWVSPEWATPDEQFTEVVVRARLENATKTNGVGPGGRYRLWYEYSVYYDMEYPPEPNQTYYIDISDDSDTADEDARILGRKTAHELRHGLWFGSIKVSWNHLIEPYDVITIAEEAEEDEGVFRRLWRCVIDGISHAWGDELSTTLDFSAILIKEEKIAEPVVPIGKGSTGVMDVRSVRGWKMWNDQFFTFDELSGVTYDDLS